MCRRNKSSRIEKPCFPGLNEGVGKIKKLTRPDKYLYDKSARPNVRSTSEKIRPAAENKVDITTLAAKGLGTKTTNLEDNARARSIGN